MALTGFLINQGHSTICAADSAAAIVALGGRFPVVAGSQPVICSLQGVSFVEPNVFNSTINCHDLIASTAWTATHAAYLARCDPDTTGAALMFNDGLSMGWGVVAAMFAALAVAYLVKVLPR
ncbi:MAG: hypothetical protein HYS19_02360 [Nitrosomonadales bacterium]|nr:hypothetical protein [Nitrosomonadales bacterium]